MKVKIWAPQHLAVHAYSLCKTINLLKDKLGFEAELADEVKMRDFGVLYILYCPQVLRGFVPEMSGNYIVYNTEHADRFLSGKSNELIFKNAKQIWHHIELTQKIFSRYHSLIKSQIVPPGVVSLDIPQPLTRPFDITFCGTMNERRWKIIQFFSNHGLSVNVITQPDEVYGQEMMDIYSSSKIILNLHFEERAPLELFRIHEALSCGCHVISELDEVSQQNFNYSEVVYFIKQKTDMVLWAKYLLDNHIKFNFDVHKLDNMQHVQNALIKL